MDIDTKKKLGKLLQNTGDMALKRRAREIVENLNPVPGDAILDVGCGDGYYLHLISQLGIKNLSLTGTDYDKGALKSAKENLKKKSIKLVWSDLMEKTPFSANFFDKIVMSEVVEHLPNDLRGLKEVCRILKPGGILSLSVPNANYPFFWDPVNYILEHIFKTHISKGFFSGLWNQHLRLYKPEEIEKVVLKAGFKIIKRKSLTFWCLPFNHYIVNMTARIIHSGKLSGDLKAAVNKYETKIKRPFLLDLAFSVVNTLDKLNDLLPVNGSGVGVYILAIKNKKNEK